MSYLVTLMTEAFSALETSVSSYETILCNISEGSHLYTRLRENLTYHLALMSSCQASSVSERVRQVGPAITLPRPGFWGGPHACWHFLEVNPLKPKLL